MTKTVSRAGMLKHQSRARHNQGKVASGSPIANTDNVSRMPKRTTPVSKPGLFATDAETAGWEVERIRNKEQGTKTVRATRDSEVVVLQWRDDNYLGGEYTNGRRSVKMRNASDARKVLNTPAEEAAKSAAIHRVSGRVMKVRIPFDVETSTDPEILKAVAGRTIRWQNALVGEEEALALEEGVVPVNGKQTRIDSDEREGSQRQLTFCSADGTGYRTLRLSAIVTVL